MLHPSSSAVPALHPSKAPVRTRWIDRRLSLAIISGGLLVVLAFSLIAGLALGGARIPLPDTLRFIGAALTGGEIARADVPAYQIVWQVRAPRVLLAAIVGAGLSAAGAVIQAMVRNVLADPFLLGISSGASVGAVGVTIGGAGMASLGLGALVSAAGTGLVTVGAFLGAMGASVLVWAASWRRDTGVTPVRLVLTGVTLAAGFTAVMSVLIYLVPDTESTSTVLFWSMGSFGAASWSMLPVVGLMVLVALIWFRTQASALDVLALGDEAAASLGVDATRSRRGLFVATALATGAMTAVSGCIGFVGLVMPHVVRMVVGARHTRVLVVAPLAGAVFMVWVDLIARTLVAPRELPLGAITALVGVPVFIALLRRRGQVLGGAR